MTDHTLPRHKNARNDLTAEYVRSILDYDPETGNLIRKVRPGKSKGILSYNARFAGKPAATYDKVNHRFFATIDYKAYLAHRLIWLIHYGKWPEFEIDHIDGDGTNNKINNLREASSRQNIINRETRIGKSGVRGVRYRDDRGKWVARMCVNYNHKHLGYFDTLEEAVSAREAAEKEFHGEFSVKNSRKPG